MAPAGAVTAAAKTVARKTATNKRRIRPPGQSDRLSPEAVSRIVPTIDCTVNPTRRHARTDDTSGIDRDHQLPGSGSRVYTRTSTRRATVGVLGRRRGLPVAGVAWFLIL